MVVYNRLPESVEEISEVLGRDKALEFIGRLPQSGTRRWRVCVYIPKRISVSHDLVARLGWDDAVAMTRAFSGMILQPSNCGRIYRHFRKTQVVRLAGEGMSSSEIAELVDLSVSRVREITRSQTKTKEAANG